ncbi:hypothetical protein D3C72_2045890 [compost metagenome]
MELIGLEPQVAVAVGFEIGSRNRKMLMRNATGALPRIWRKRRDIHKPHHIGLVTRLGNHRTTVRMPHQEDRPLLLGNHLAGTLDIVSKRCQRHFNGADVRIPLSRQFNDDFSPMRGTSPETVHQNDRGLAHDLTPICF